MVISNLKTKVFRHVTYFPTIGSTNEEAIRRAKEGAREGEIFIADHQTAGRGRLDRKWESPAGKNLHISFLLRPTVSPSQAAWITLMAGVAVHEALTPFIPDSLKTDLKIKWPNDLYLQGKKIAGILSVTWTQKNQPQSGVEGEAPQALPVEGATRAPIIIVCGIGIDLNAEEGDFSQEVRKVASSIKMATGQEIDRIEVARRLIENFEKRYFALCKNGPGDLIAFHDRHSYLKWRRVVAEGHDGLIEGIESGLGPNGALLIRTDSGEIVPIIAGDLNLVSF